MHRGWVHRPMAARWGDWLVVADQTHKIHLFEIRAKGSGVELHKAVLPVNQYATTSMPPLLTVLLVGAFPIQKMHQRQVCTR